MLLNTIGCFEVLLYMNNKKKCVFTDLMRDLHFGTEEIDKAIAILESLGLTEEKTERKKYETRNISITTKGEKVTIHIQAICDLTGETIEL